MSTHRRPVVAAVALSALLVLTSCAGTLRDRFRAGALVAGETALAIDDAEGRLYAAGTYGLETHQQAVKAIIVMLRATRAYERAVRAWPEHLTMPSTVPQALADALAAIADVRRVLTGIPGASPLLDRLRALEVRLGGGA